MPQHLRVEVEDSMVGRLTTYNKDGCGNTLYDLTLCIQELETDFFLPGVDTKVPRQPEPPEERKADFQNDFMHAIRCIAAVVESANEFLTYLHKCKPEGIIDIKPITMRLMTNKFDRGIIQVKPSNRNSDVSVIIGTGNNRVKESYPKDEWKWSRLNVEECDMTSQMGRALAIIKTIGPDLLSALTNAKDEDISKIQG